MKRVLFVIYILASAILFMSFAEAAVRGFLAPTAVPEPSTLLLLGSGLMGLGFYGRRRFKK
jgi:hypothetical protein